MGGLQKHRRDQWQDPEAWSYSHTLPPISSLSYVLFVSPRTLTTVQSYGSMENRLQYYGGGVPVLARSRTLRQTGISSQRRYCTITARLDLGSIDPGTLPAASPPSLRQYHKDEHVIRPPRSSLTGSCAHLARHIFIGISGSNEEGVMRGWVLLRLLSIAHRQTPSWRLVPS